MEQMIVVNGWGGKNGRNIILIKGLGNILAL
jgi:hypothetical protein